jgi:hypothetical protein
MENVDKISEVPPAKKRYRKVKTGCQTCKYAYCVLLNDILIMMEIYDWALLTKSE